MDGNSSGRWLKIAHNDDRQFAEGPSVTRRRALPDREEFSDFWVCRVATHL